MLSVKDKGLLLHIVDHCLRVEETVSKKQTTGEAKIREVTLKLLREVGFRRGHQQNKLSILAAFFVL